MSVLSAAVGRVAWAEWWESYGMGCGAPHKGAVIGRRALTKLTAVWCGSWARLHTAVLVVFSLLTCTSPVAQAQVDAASDEHAGQVAENGHSLLSGNIGIFSQYESRGLSYSHEQVAPEATVQVGADTGPYIGVFGSKVSRLEYDGANAEFDPYGGYVLTRGDVSLDVGIWSWLYFTGRLRGSGNRYETVEAYVGITFKNVDIHYSYDLKDYFGLNSRSASVDYGVDPAGSSQGSSYTEANVKLPLTATLKLILHVAHEDVKHYAVLSCNEWRAALEFEAVEHVTLSVYWVDTDAHGELYRDLGGLNTARGKWVGFVRWSF